MSSHEYRLIAMGWSILIIFLTIFWYATLRRLSTVLNEHLASTGTRKSVEGIAGVFQFLIRGEFKKTGDERLVGVCERLRRLLYGYLGATGAYVVFIVLMHSRY